MLTSLQIAKIWGIPIKLDMSLIILVVLVISNYGFTLGPPVALGILLSIILHELGHSVVAILYGCRVRQITLMFTGGAAQMERIPRKPLAEFLMAAAGPFVSLLIGISCFLIDPYVPLARYENLAGKTIVGWIGIVNLTLLVFNLLPAFPMDGGRIFRAMLTPFLGRVRATGVAARVGQGFAVFMGLSGIVGCGVIPSGSWLLVAIAFFIFIAAGSEYRMVRMEEARRRGSAFPPPWPPQESSDSDEDRVIISPPPWKDEPDSETEVRRDNDWRNPFGN